jgi:hypothetical protein
MTLRWETKHTVVLAALLVTTGTQVATLPDWTPASRPQFIGQLLLQIGTTLGALFVGSPTERRRAAGEPWTRKGDSDVQEG